MSEMHTCHNNFQWVRAILCSSHLLLLKTFYEIHVKMRECLKSQHNLYDGRLHAKNNSAFAQYSTHDSMTNT